MRVPFKIPGLPGGPPLRLGPSVGLLERLVGSGAALISYVIRIRVGKLRTTSAFGCALGHPLCSLVSREFRSRIPHSWDRYMSRPGLCETKGCRRTFSGRVAWAMNR